MSFSSSRVIIRTDATRQIGVGHMMRSLALAQAWQYRGGMVTFVSYCESDGLKSRILDEGFDFVPMCEPGGNQRDAKALVRFLDQEKNASEPPWCVLDGYGFDHEYQYSIRQTGCKLLVVDDYNHLPHYHSDIIFNQNIGANHINYVCDPDTQLLLGTKYVLLRNEFVNRERSDNHEFPEKAVKILVTFGGADPDNVMRKVFRAFELMGDPDMDVIFVVGPASANGGFFEKAADSVPFTANVLTNVKTMSSIMARADMAVSAGGSTCWELAFMGIPFAVATIAENQRKLVLTLERENAALNLGWHENMSSLDVSRALKKMMRDRDKRKQFSEKGRNLVDGKGRGRVIERMRPTPITLRNATEKDCEMVWKWANEPDARAVSFHSDFIAWEEHQEWFAARLNDENYLFFVVCGKRDESMGQVRFEIDSSSALISTSLAKEFRGYGLGSRVISAACKKAMDLRDLNAIQAIIKRTNEISLKTFKQADFKKTREFIFKGSESVEMVHYREGA